MKTSGLKQPMSGRRFLAVFSGSVVAIMVLSLLYGPYGKVDGAVVHLGLYNLTQTPMFLGLNGLRLLAALAITAALTLPTMVMLEVRTWREFQHKLEIPHNNSHIFLVGGFFLGAIFMARNTPLTAYDAYLSLIAYRTGLSILITLGLTLLAAFASGVHTFAEFKEWVDTPSNDSHAIMVAFLFAGMMYLLS